MSIVSGKYECPVCAERDYILEITEDDEAVFICCLSCGYDGSMKQDFIVLEEQEQQIYMTVKVLVKYLNNVAVFIGDNMGYTIGPDPYYLTIKDGVTTIAIFQLWTSVVKQTITSGTITGTPEYHP